MSDDNPYQSPESDSTPPRTDYRFNPHLWPNWRFWVLLTIASFAVSVLILNAWASVSYSWSLEWRLFWIAIAGSALLLVALSGAVILLFWRNVATSSKRKVPSLQSRRVAVAIGILATFDGLVLLLFFTAILLPTTTKESYDGAMLGFVGGCFAAFMVGRIAHALWRDTQRRE